MKQLASQFKKKTIKIFIMKGNLTVVLDTSTYMDRMKELLYDTNIYSIVKKSPIRMITSGLKNITRWKDAEFISISINFLIVQMD